MNNCINCAKLSKQLKKAEQALKFYADPYSYFTIALIADPPEGPFYRDCSKILTG
jgi:hypothetical protein